MAYVKLNLQDGHVLDEDDMAHIEDGIYTNDGAIEALEDELGDEDLPGTVYGKIKANEDAISDINTSHETWTFTLEDDTTVTKEVMIYNGD